MWQLAVEMYDSDAIGHNTTEQKKTIIGSNNTNTKQWTIWQLAVQL